MAEPKTKPSKTTVTALIASVENDRRRRDAKTLLKLMREVTGIKPKVWGDTMIGFGSYDYTYDSGHSGTTRVRAAVENRTAAAARHLAESVPGARLVVYPTGGHVWVGHDNDIMDEIGRFVEAL